MKTILLVLFTISASVAVCAQGELQFDPGKSKAVLPFKLINNLIFVPVEVNGVEMTFLLDSGVEETILFSLDDTGEVSFANVETIRLRGLGSQHYIECLKSSDNRLKFRGMFAKNHDIYIVLDQDFNFSSHIGIPVNGIIGYQFFKNNIVEINYDKKKIFIYKDYKKIQKRIGKFTELPISVESQKPYVIGEIIQEDVNTAAKLLIDTGSSDAVWLFRDRENHIELPENNFEDYLGRGFSGDILGRRARIPQFGLGEFKFKDPIAAFPDSTSIRNIKMVENRVGSVGGEILRRFCIIFDYRNSKLFLRKGTRFYDPFQYNMSGIELHHEGLQWVQETVQLSPAKIVAMYDHSGNKERDFKYKFELKPIYRISSIRKDSPAFHAGLQKGDIILMINNSRAYRYTLEEIAMALKSEAGKSIELEVERDGKTLKFRFQLQSIL